MADTELASEDPSMAEAVQAIMKLPPEARGFDTEPKPDPRENRDPLKEARDTTEKETSTDLEESERAEAEAKAKAEPEREAKSAEGDEEDYIEIPAEAEGGEAERVPLAKAVEAIKQVREFQGGVAAAINKAEAEYSSKQDAVLTAALKTFQTVRERADTVLKAIPAPRLPSQELLNPQSQYYNPEAYHTQKIAYDEQVQTLNWVKAQADQARQAEAETETAMLTQRADREYARLARHPGFEKWGDPQTRDGEEKAMLGKLNKLYGVSMEDLAGIRDHRFFLMARDLIEAKEAKVKAPEVKTAVKERVAKITKGNAQQSRDTSTGKFVSEARENLRKTGSEEAAAAYFLRSGLAKI